MTNENVTLPLLPLTSGVVLPGMVFTMALESDEARAAVEAARSAGGRLLLVPHIEGRYAARRRDRRGAWRRATCPAGCPPWPSGVTGRAVIGTGVPGTGDALWVEAEPLDEPEPTPAANELAREYRAVLENILLSRGAGRIAAQLREVTEPSRLADVSGYSPDLSLTPEGRGPRDARRRGAAAPRPRLGPRHPGRPDAARADQDRRRRGHGEDAARVPAAPPARGHPQGARPAQRERSDEDDPDDYRAKLDERDLPEHVRKAVEREVDKLERTSDQSPETGWIRTWLDTVLRAPLGRRVRGPARRRRGVAHPRRRPRRAGGREGAHPRAPGRAQAAGRARPGAGGRARLRGHPGPGRAPRASARRRSASRWRAPSGASSSGSRSAACATRPRSAATAAPTSGPSRAAWCAPCARPGP